MSKRKLDRPFNIYTDNTSSDEEKGEEEGESEKENSRSRSRKRHQHQKPPPSAAKTVSSSMHQERVIDSDEEEKKYDSPSPSPSHVRQIQQPRARQQLQQKVNRGVSNVNAPGVRFSMATLDEMAGVAGETQPLPEKKYKKLFETCFIDTDEEASTNDPDWCFWCRCGQTKRDSERQQVFVRLIQHIEENYHNADPVQFAGDLQDIYNTLGRPYVLPGKPVWRRKVIWEHIQNHAPLPCVISENNNRALNLTMAVLSNKLILQSMADEEEQELDTANVRLFLTLQKAQMESTKAVKSQRNTALL